METSAKGIIDIAVAWWTTVLKERKLAPERAERFSDGLRTVLAEQDLDRGLVFGTDYQPDDLLRRACERAGFAPLALAFHFPNKCRMRLSANLVAAQKDAGEWEILHGLDPAALAATARVQEEQLVLAAQERVNDQGEQLPAIARANDKALEALVGAAAAKARIDQERKPEERPRLGGLTDGPAAPHAEPGPERAERGPGV